MLMTHIRRLMFLLKLTPSALKSAVVSAVIAKQ